MDAGQTYEGTSLGALLESHTATFTTVSSVPAEMVLRGVEPAPATEVRNRLFSIAHNALTNAFRHAHARGVGVELDFGTESVRLPVSDDGVGLPDDYAQRGQGFAECVQMRRPLAAASTWKVAEGVVALPSAAQFPASRLKLNGLGRETMTTSSEPIRVMLVDDHPVVKVGLRGMPEDLKDLEIVGEASDGVEAVEMAERLEPVVIVMDVMMPRLDGIEACRTIMEKLPSTQVLMLTASTERDAVIEAEAAGATGYLQKYSGGEELEQAIREIAEGHLRIPHGALRRTLAMVRDELWDKTRYASSALPERERELLTPFASSNPYARIAEAKGISPVTVRNTIPRIQDKLGLATKQELVIWAVKNGLVPEPSN